MIALAADRLKAAPRRQAKPVVLDTVGSERTLAFKRLRAEASTASGAWTLERSTGRAVARWLLAAVYVPFGVFHMVDPAPFLPIMPAWVPAPGAIIVFTGACEVAGGIGLLVPATRWWAGVMLALYAVAVFPANLHHALDHVTVPGLPSSWWYHAPRLAFQPVFVWWALWAGEVIDWPFRSRPARA